MFEEKLQEMNLKLPKLTKPGGNYVSVNIRANIAYLAIQFPIRDGEFLYRGKLGAEISTDEGYKAMEICALNVLSQIDDKVGIDQVLGLNHIDAYYRSVADWDESPKVADGASDLFVRVLEEQGKHSRSIFGVEHLPRNFSLGLKASFTLKE